MSNHRDTSGELRDMHSFSGSDHFMSGHQIINRNLAYSGYRRAAADWSKDDHQVKALLLRVFPKLETDARQRARAGRWMRVIQLHHRSGYSYGDVAAEMKISVTAVKTILQRIRHGIKGVPRNLKRRKKNGATFGTSLGDQ